MTTPPVLSYGVAVDRHKGLRLFIVSYCSSLLFAGAVLGFLVCAVPHFRATYNRFLTTVPPLTGWVLNASDAVSMGAWVWLVPLAFVGPLVPALLYWKWQKRRGRRRILAVGLVVLYLAIAGTLVVAVVQPLY